MKNRVYKWDNAKFVAIIGVVIGHMIIRLMEHGNWPQYRSLFFFIYSFHMPLFFFLAGLVQRPFGKEDKLNTGKLMMFFRGFLFINIFNWCGHIWVGTDSTLKLLNPTGAEWFFLAMIVFTLVVYFTRGTSIVYLIIFSIVVACFTGYDASLHKPMIMVQLFTNLPYYLVGYALTSEQVLEFTEKKWVKIVGFVFLCALAAFSIANPELVTDFRYALTHGKVFAKIGPGLHWYHEIFVYILSACSVISVLAIMPNKKIPAITTWGSRTLNVYLLHRGIVFMLVSSDLWITMKDAMGKPVFMIVWLVISVVLTCVLSTKPVDVLAKIILGIEFPWKKKVKKGNEE